MNNTYKIKVGSPLLRPGLTIETECSERYLGDVLQRVLDAVREFNHPTPPAMPEQAGASIAECDDINQGKTTRFSWYGTPEEVARAQEQIRAREGWRSGSVRDDPQDFREVWEHNLYDHDSNFVRGPFDPSAEQVQARRDAQIKDFEDMMRKATKRGNL